MVEGTAQSAHPSQVQLACPSGLVDPFDTTNVAAATTWSSLSGTPISPAPASVTGTGGVIPTALTLAGQGGGELAGLSAVGCAAPRTSQWIAAGATTSGADMVLILSNPGPTASVVSVDGYGATGPINTAPRQVTVAAGTTVSVLLAGWFPDEGSLAVHVQADGGGVAAWAQASLMNGEIPQGTTLASAVVPATTQTILGVDPSGTSLLRLVAPSGEAHVSVSVADSDGVHPLGGGQATVAQGSTLEMPLDGASKDSTPIALIVSSDREIVAQTTTITLGAPWAERANAWIMRSNAAPATSLTAGRHPRPAHPGVHGDAGAVHHADPRHLGGDGLRRERDARQPAALRARHRRRGLLAGRRRAIRRPRAHGDPEHLGLALTRGDERAVRRPRRRPVHRHASPSTPGAVHGSVGGRTVYSPPACRPW